jgi:hypothetical protein
MQVPASFKIQWICDHVGQGLKKVKGDGFEQHVALTVPGYGYAYWSIFIPDRRQILLFKGKRKEALPSLQQLDTLFSNLSC